MPVCTILCTPADVNAAVGRYYPKEARGRADGRGRRHGHGARADVATPVAKDKAEQAADASEAAPTADKATMKKRQQMGAGLGLMWGLDRHRAVGQSGARAVVKNWGLGTNLKLYGTALVLGLVLAGIGFVIGGMFKKA